jgi:hypothetical protein
LQAVVACAFLASAAPSVRAQRPAVLRGSVLRDADDAPIPGAEIGIPGLGISVLADSTGNFRLPAIAPGKQIVWVRKLGFAPISTVLTFTAGDTLDREFTLLSAAQTLPGVAIKAPPHESPKIAEFEERRRAGFGHFLTEDQLQKMPNRKPAEIMVTVPGTYISRDPRSSAAFVAGGRGEGRVGSNGVFMPCFSAVVLDGVFVFQGKRGEPLFDINSIETSTIAGIEYYSGAASIPAKYNGTRNTCGLVVIWTR